MDFLSGRKTRTIVTVLTDYPSSGLPVTVRRSSLER